MNLSKQQTHRASHSPDGIQEALMNCPLGSSLCLFLCWVKRFLAIFRLQNCQVFGWGGTVEMFNPIFSPMHCSLFNQ